MFFHRLFTPGLAINTYIIADSNTKEGAIIDPTRDIEPILKLVAQEGITISHLLETHVHADFISGTKELKHRLDNKPIIYCSGLGGEEWIPKYADKILYDRQEIQIGNIRISCWHTPGHTPEHLMYVVYDESRAKKDPNIAFTGDFLLVGSIGRPDLLGEKVLNILASKLYYSVFHVLPELPDFVEIFPAHGAGSACAKGIGTSSSSTIGYERHANSALVTKEESAWINSILTNMPKAPNYFSHLKILNVDGVDFISQLKPPKEISLQELSELNQKEIFILDTRSKEEFAEKHLPGSINIAFGPQFNKWIPEIVPYDTPIYVIIKESFLLNSALSSLRLVGLDQVVGYSEFTPTNIEKTKVKIESFPLCSPEFIAKKQKEQEKLCILDVRTMGEWNAGHIQDAIHIELNDLNRSINQLPKDKPIAVLCGSGYRASTGASMLQKAGFKDIYNIQGGMHGWNKAQLPVVQS